MYKVSYLRSLFSGLLHARQDKSDLSTDHYELVTSRYSCVGRGRDHGPPTGDPAPVGLASFTSTMRSPLSRSIVLLDPPPA